MHVVILFYNSGCKHDFGHDRINGSSRSISHREGINEIIETKENEIEYIFNLCLAARI